MAGFWHFDMTTFGRRAMRAKAKSVRDAFLPPIALDVRGAKPIYRQLYDWYQQAILEGRLKPGQRVPSSRGLARELKVSRIPVLTAYEQLHAEGYLETFKGAGTSVAASIPRDPFQVSAA